MAQLPLEPVYARVLLASFAEGCPREIIDLVSLLGSRDQLIINTASTREQANAARQKFVHRTGDHMMLLNILRAYEELDGKDERKAWCMDNFVSFKAIQSVLDARKQLRERVERLGLGDWEESVGDDAEPVLNALVGGLFAKTALLQEDGSYRHTLTKQVGLLCSEVRLSLLNLANTSQPPFRTSRSTRPRRCTTKRRRRSSTTSSS